MISYPNHYSKTNVVLLISIHKKQPIFDCLKTNSVGLWFTVEYIIIVNIFVGCEGFFRAFGMMLEDTGIIVFLYLKLTP